MVKIDFALLALAALGPTLGAAYPTDADGQDAPDLVARQSNRFTCNYSSSKRARASTVAACIDSIAEYGKDGKACPVGRYRVICKKFPSISVSVFDGGESRAPCAKWARDLGAFLDRCTDDRGTINVEAA
ncbi:uncharacterized protein FTJAE_10933 [Fusarium tjaetaba]|uniref:Uncharacterized protein n=1 Tax=Fusarium tjaetaba TaxID=1567544 RepID=A0A8H5VF84_9HYPO|nr:uncharacterized protein FTJAE_10933 [Fusarium tjaetaba]KAF5622397.1 hypothetical protein FTJAE_10933 [Fusarium tjaetaba]